MDFKHIFHLTSRFLLSDLSPRSRKHAQSRDLDEHLWFKKKQILQSVKKNNLFKVIKLVGYQPNRDKLVDIPLSHVIFLKARRTNNKLISIN